MCNFAETNRAMIKIKSFVFNPFQENTYVVSEQNGKCMIVDPGMYDHAERQILKTYLEAEKLRPEILVNTHCHIDHVFGNEFISREYGLTPKIHTKESVVLQSVPAVASMYGVSYSPSPEPEFFEGDHLLLGEERFDILFVPGHAPGHVALYHAESGTVLAGDVLFRESIGRTDLPGGDMATLLESIRKELFTLPDDTTVYAGHMEPTTIGHEKRYNPFLK